MSAELERHYRNIGQITVAASGAETMLGAIVHAARGRDMWPGDDTWLNESATNTQAVKRLQVVISKFQEGAAGAGDAHKEPIEKLIKDLVDLKQEWHTNSDKRGKMIHGFVTIDFPMKDGAMTISTGEPITYVRKHPKDGSQGLLGDDECSKLVESFDAIARDAGKLMAPVALAADKLKLDFSDKNWN